MSSESNYKLKLNLFNISENTENYDETNLDKNICSFCGVKSGTNLTVCLKNKKQKINSCYMCRIIANFNSCHTNELILCKSKMKQVDIVKNSYDYFKTHSKMPPINEIDKDAKRVNCSVLKFILIRNHSKKKLKKFVVFFSGEVANILLKQSFSYFNPIQASLDNYNNKYFDLPLYELSKKEEKIFKKFNKHQSNLTSTKNNKYKADVNKMINKAKLKIEILKNHLK